jgi:hypothetical protein
MIPSVWTFRLLGGEPLKMQVGLPWVEHDGSLSLWNLLLTAQQAYELETLLVSRGVRVSRWSEAPDAEAQAEREVLLKAQRGEVVYLTVQCPSCFWMDLGVEDRCGLRKWHKDTRDEALRMYDKARADALTCPLLKDED